MGWLPLASGSRWELGGSPWAKETAAPGSSMAPMTSRSEMAIALLTRGLPVVSRRADACGGGTDIRLAPMTPTLGAVWLHLQLSALWAEDCAGQEPGVTSQERRSLTYRRSGLRSLPTGLSDACESIRRLSRSARPKPTRPCVSQRTSGALERLSLR
jgi:hypothetical protein